MLKFNYGEYVFQQLITTEFVQHKLAQILIAIAANFINMHIVTILCLIVSVNVYIDFILQIAISVTCALNIGHVYNFVQRYEAEFYQLTQYLINNYSIENYRYWKRLIVIGACVYASVALLMIELSNWVIFLYIFQYAICYLIIEQFEQQRIQKWLRDYQTRPVAKILDTDSDFLINSYMSPKSKVLRIKSQHTTTQADIILGNGPSGNISSGSTRPSYRQGLKSVNMTPNSITGSRPRLYSVKNHSKSYNRYPN